MNYGRALRTCRAARGIQQQDVAEVTGLTKSYLSLVEAGKRTPSTTAIGKICSALNIPVHLFSLLAAESDDLQRRPAEEISVLARSLLEILTMSDGEDDGSQARLL